MIFAIAATFKFKSETKNNNTFPSIHHRSVERDLQCVKVSVETKEFSPEFLDPEAKLSAMGSALVAPSACSCKTLFTTSIADVRSYGVRSKEVDSSQILSCTGNTGWVGYMGNTLKMLQHAAIN